MSFLPGNTLTPANFDRGGRSRSGRNQHASNKLSEAQLIERRRAQNRLAQRRARERQQIKAQDQSPDQVQTAVSAAGSSPSTDPNHGINLDESLVPDSSWESELQSHPEELLLAAVANPDPVYEGQGSATGFNWSQSSTPAHDNSRAGHTLMPNLHEEQSSSGDEDDHSNHATCLQSSGNTALHQSITNGHLAIMHALLQRGADIRIVNDRGRTALHIAAEKGNNLCVQALLTHGAVVDARDNDGFTPLQIAATNGHSQSVLTLLSHGADINSRISCLRPGSGA